MNSEQIALAREAMGLQGAPACALDDECPYALVVVSADSCDEGCWPGGER